MPAVSSPRRHSHGVNVNTQRLQAVAILAAGLVMAAALIGLRLLLNSISRTAAESIVTGTNDT